MFFLIHTHCCSCAYVVEHFTCGRNTPDRTDTNVSGCFSRQHKKTKAKKIWSCACIYFCHSIPDVVNYWPRGFIITRIGKTTAGLWQKDSTLKYGTFQFEISKINLVMVKATLENSKLVEPAWPWAFAPESVLVNHWAVWLDAQFLAPYL